MKEKDIDEKLRKLHSLSPRDAKVVLNLFLSGNTEARREAEELLDVRRPAVPACHQRLQEGDLPRPPEASLCRGEYNLGAVIYPPGKPYTSFGMREDEWLKHMMITGITGSGKTNLAFYILSEFVRHGKRFIVFDFKSTSTYRDLL